MELSSVATDDAQTVMLGGLPNEQQDEQPPEPGLTHLGRYTVLAELGRGAMGRVFRAYDPKLQRDVALKQLLNKRFAGERTLRLIAEARAMAKLSHPNVVAVHDVEELGDGHLVLVMEYVEGTTLDLWLAERPRSWEEILRVFVQAGRGLEAAHRADLLHRDFKPANVLVGRDGSIKVTDFGLAKLGDPSLSSAGEHDDSSLEGDGLTGELGALTQAGTVLGTPRYMSPEQHRGQPLTDAADQYAFCVALWEALAGRSVFGGRHTYEAKLRGPAPLRRPGLPRALIDAMVRGLAVDPRARWSRLSDLLDVLERVPSHRKRRRYVMAGAAAVLVLAGGAWRTLSLASDHRCSGAEAQLAPVWSPSRRAEAEAAMLAIDAPYADVAWNHAREELDRYANAWTSMYTEACEATTLRGEQSMQVMDMRMACLRRAALTLGAVVDVFVDADARVAENAHDVLRELPPVARCADVQTLMLEADSPDPEEAALVDDVRRQLAAATAAAHTGRYETAKLDVDTAKSIADTLTYAPIQTEIAFCEGKVQTELGNYDTAEAALRRALGLAATHRQWKEQRAAAITLMYVVGYWLQRPEEALRYRELAEAGDLDLRERIGLTLALNQIHDAQGRFVEVEEGYRSVLPLMEAELGAEHYDVAMWRNNLGVALFGQGRHVEAEAEHRLALRLFEGSLGREHPSTGLAVNNLANDLQRQDRIDEAIAEYRHVIALWSRTLGPDHPKVAGARSNLGNALAAEQRFEEAKVEFAAARMAWEASLGPTHPDVSFAREGLANVYVAERRFVEAEVEHRAAVILVERTLGPEHERVADLRWQLARDLAELGRPREAEAEYRVALRIYERIPDSQADAAAILGELATVLRGDGRESEAQALDERAREVAKRDGAAASTQ